jgi:hypothetical protein
MCVVTFSVETRIVRYVVGMDWASEYRDFRSIDCIGEGPTWSNLRATLYFFAGQRPDGGSRPPIGWYHPDRRQMYALLNIEDFDAIYAILRTEKPVYLRAWGPDTTTLTATLEILEFHSNEEPVGEVDDTPGRRTIGSTGDAVAGVDDPATFE